MRLNTLLSAPAGHPHRIRKIKAQPISTAHNARYKIVVNISQNFNFIPPFSCLIVRRIRSINPRRNRSP